MRVVVGIALTVLLGLLAGCAGTEESGQVMSAPSVVAQDSSSGENLLQREPSVIGDKAQAETYGGAGAAGVPAPSQQMIVRNASLELRVKDADDAVTSVRSAVKTFDGEIADLSLSGGEPDVYLSDSGVAPSPVYATITIRVPAQKLDALSLKLSALGTVVSQSESASDVTEQAIDMEARLKNLRAEEERLRALLQRTNKVSELLAVEAELSRVRGEIESMDAQLTYLKRQAARATLVVTLSEPSSVTGSSSPWFGIQEAIARGFRGALSVVETLITFFIAVIPLLVVAVLITAAIAVPLRRRSRRSALVARDEHDESEEA